MIAKRKVLAYITRGIGQNKELLVFEHEDAPGAGLQVPGGTVEENELLVDAVYREIFEETGIPLEDLKLHGKIHTCHYSPTGKDLVYERTFFHLDYVGKERDAWRHCVKGGGEDDGMIFTYRYEPLETLPKLAGEQDTAIEFIKIYA